MEWYLNYLLENRPDADADELKLAEDLSELFNKFKEQTKDLHPFSNLYQELKVTFNLEAGEMIGYAKAVREMKEKNGK